MLEADAGVCGVCVYSLWLGFLGLMEREREFFLG